MSTPATPSDFQAKVLSTLETLGKKVGELDNAVAQKAAERVTGAVPNHAPWARKGENIMGSRGFSFAKLIGSIAGVIPHDQAKMERELSQRMRQNFTAHGYQIKHHESQMAPIAPSFFSKEHVSDTEYHEMKQMLNASIEGADREEAEWLQKKAFEAQGKAATAASPSMSWIDSSVGATFVPPPMFGEPIELLRNKEALMNAGATVVPLGPSGRMILPRLTSATQGGWVGENTVQAPINPVTGQVTLGAKKVMGLVVLPNEFLRFATPAGETMVRNDLFKTIALIADNGFLLGPGSDVQPLGLITMATTSVASTTAGTISSSSYGCVYVNATGSNQLAPQDLYNFRAGIEENNGTPTAWIMRPTMRAGIAKSRFTPYSGGDSKGTFIFDLTRSMGDGTDTKLDDMKIISTAQMPNNRGTTIGTTGSTNTTVLCLDATDYIIGMFGAIEFFQTDQGWNLASADQSLIRAILSCDGAMRHPGLVACSDAISTTVAG